MRNSLDMRLAIGKGLASFFFWVADREPTDWDKQVIWEATQDIELEECRRRADFEDFWRERKSTGAR